MSKFPFKDCSEKYMETMRGVYSPETWNNRARRYHRMNEKIKILSTKKLISTTSPKNFTPEDVHAYITYCQESQSPSDMAHEVNALNNLLKYSDNYAVEKCFNKYPGLKPKMKQNVRKYSLTDETIDLIMKRVQTLDMDDFRLVRAYTLVTMAITTGTRNKEIRLANVQDIDTTEWTFDIVHVKGEDTYGQPRSVPICPGIRALLLSYLLLIKRWKCQNKIDSPALFPSKGSSDGYLSSNGIREIKNIVEKDLDIKFELRACRRTFGQKYIDSDLDIESVSVLMGHSTTRTTEKFYGRRRNLQAIEKAKRVWDNSVKTWKNDDSVGGQDHGSVGGQGNLD